MERLKHVLVIEDNPLICELLVAILQEKYRTSTASEGSVGLIQALQDGPDVVLCDVLMPGLHGDQVAEQLKANPVTGHIPVVLMSGHGEVSQSEGRPALFLQKPFAPGEVLRVIEEALKSGARGPAR